MAKTVKQLREELQVMLPPSLPQVSISEIEYKKRIIDVALTQLLGNNWCKKAPAYQHLIRCTTQEVKSILRWHEPAPKRK